MTDQTDWFAQACYGMFIHFGLYSLLERGEWALNREQIPLAATKLAQENRVVRLEEV